MFGQNDMRSTTNKYTDGPQANGWTDCCKITHKHVLTPNGQTTDGWTCGLTFNNVRTEWQPFNNGQIHGWTNIFVTRLHSRGRSSNTVTKFFKLITLGKFNALVSRTTDEWIDSWSVVKLLANVCWWKTDRQHADGQTDGQIWFFCLSHDNVLEKKVVKILQMSF